ncbi:MAG: hypothetical protein MPJ50_13875 [Pirellulales bacterium]|nr:hypothetical protein [Pirellulales bacterium]
MQIPYKVLLIFVLSSAMTLTGGEFSHALGCQAREAASASAGGLLQEVDGLPLVFATDFESTDAGDLPAEFEFTDAAAWKIESVEERGNVLSQHKASSYQPPHRSPHNVGLVKDLWVRDLVLTARVRSTIRDYGHRDACVFFGHRDAAHFYYVHFGKQTDDHANQVFIVNDAARTKISDRTTTGTPWDDSWHHVKIVRNTEQGDIKVYFDNMETPVMEASSKAFVSGRVGLGSFDDTTQWDDVRIYGQVVEGAVKHRQRTKTPPDTGRRLKRRNDPDGI